MKKTYTRSEADEILRRALAEQAEGDISHDELLAAAREVGIPESAIHAAAEQLGESYHLQRHVGVLRQRKRRAFFRHLVSFVIINAGIFAFDWFNGGAWFFHFPLIVWSVVLLLLAMAQLAPNPEALTRRAERELEKERRREAARQRRQGRADRKAIPAGEAARQFEAAVEQGVATLLSAATRAIRGLEGKRVRVESDSADAGEEGTAQQRAQRSGRA